MKAVELDAATRKRTGRELMLEAASRQAAVDELFAALGVRPEDARVDPTRTLVEVGGHLWTLVATPPAQPEVGSSLRRAGAKHRRVR